MSKVLSQNSKNIKKVRKVLFDGGLQPVLITSRQWMAFHRPEVNLYSHQDNGSVLISSPDKCIQLVPVIPVVPVLLAGYV